jgi:hypothetical protein
MVRMIGLATGAATAKRISRTRLPRRCKTGMIGLLEKALVAELGTWPRFTWWNTVSLGSSTTSYGLSRKLDSDEAELGRLLGCWTRIFNRSGCR